MSDSISSHKGLLVVLIISCILVAEVYPQSRTHVDRQLANLISVALRTGEKKTLITSDIGTQIYLSTVSIAIPGAGSPVTLAWVVFPHDRVTFRTLRVNKIGPSNHIYESYSPKGAIALINGGFYGFSEGNRESPIGLLVSDGEEFSPMMKSWKSGGVLVQRGLDTDIIPISERNKIGNPVQALQSKPLLIDNGLLAVKLNSNDATFNRAAIGLTDKGDIVVAGAFRDDTQALTLYDFGQFLALLKTTKGVNIRVALNLDGATDSHLYVVSPAQHFGYAGANYVPSALAILPR